MTYRSYRGVGAAPVWILITANVLFYVLTFLFPQITYSLALRPTSFVYQQWTLLTSMFLHGGWWHLFANMLPLYFFGTYLIGLLGETKFLLLYFIGGLLGNVLMVLLAPLAPFSFALGASGAVFAFGGALVVMRPRLRVIIFPLFIPIPLWVAVIAGMVLSFAPSIGWGAHLGGLLFGLAAGYYFRRWRRI